MVDNQHKKITGYRDLTEQEIAKMNELKALGAKVGELIDEIDQIPDIDKRFLALGRTNVQQGFMWLIRSIARPDSFV